MEHSRQRWLVIIPLDGGLDRRVGKKKEAVEKQANIQHQDITIKMPFLPIRVNCGVCCDVAM